MKISYIFPSRSRPEKFFSALENIRSLSALDTYEIIAVLDTDDPAINNDEVKERISHYPNVKPYYGISTGKINAINREIKNISDDADIVACHSDDIVFIKQDFDLDIIEAFADGFNGLCHFPDQMQQERLITYPIMHIDYLRFFKYIYNPVYTSLYSDSEQQDVAKKINKYKFVDKQILEHRHYRWGYLKDGSKAVPGQPGEPDDLAMHTDSQAMYDDDKKKYLESKWLIIVTSLSPSHANSSNQIAAIKSWQKVAPCYSLNTINEIDYVRTMYSDITFVETYKTALNMTGKPLVNINAMIDFALSKEKDLLLLNSDIILDNLPELKTDGITIFSRYDYSMNIFENNKFEAGFDVFFIPQKFLKVFPPSCYAMGAAWWDFFIPFHAIKNKIPLYYPEGKFAFHKRHPTQYSFEEWEHIGESFRWEFRLNKQLSIEQIATDTLANIKARLKK